MSEAIEKVVQRRSFRPSIRLDTLLLIMTLAAIIVAYYVADKNRDAWQQRLGRLETAVGLPRIRDVRNLELAAMRKENGWSVWIPSDQTVKLCIATEDLDNVDAKPQQEIVLRPGRNLIKIAKTTGEASASLLLNNEMIFSRPFSRLWNIQVALGASKEFEVVTTRQQLFQSYSNVRLEVDEPFDPVKHRTGLRIWLEP